MKRHALSLVLMIAASVSLARPAPAQDLSFFTGGIFKSIHSVTVYLQGTDLESREELRGASSRCLLDICGAGMEALIDLHGHSGGTHVELGVGASYLGGFRARNSVLDLRGALRSFPTFSAYATGPSFLGATGLRPYAGLSFGLSDLWNTQVYDSVSVGADSLREYTLKGQTFDYGASGGLYVDGGALSGLFGELAYKRRRFNSLDWTPDVVREGWPLSLDFSGWTASVGWQFNLKEPAKGPPAFEGTWTLSKVDGQTVPATLHQTENRVRHEWLSGLLSLEELSEAKKVGRYDLALQERITRLEGDKPKEISAPEANADRGTYEPASGDATRLTFKPWDAKRPSYVVTRMGNDLRMDFEGHVLVFTKLTP